MSISKSKPKSSFDIDQAEVSLPRSADAQTVPRTRFRNWLLCDSWALEYASLSLAVACLFGVFITLLHFDNKALADWHSDLSVNTVLSILATASKSATLLATASALGQLKWVWYSHKERSLLDFQTFDDASRGPFGAFLLLFRLPTVSLASLGALITILTLPFDVFVQGSASQPLRLKQLPGASIPVCHDYEVIVGDYDIAPLMKNTFYNAVFDTESKIKNVYLNVTDNAGMGNRTAGSITPICSTGNCTFPAYHSLAVQHQCSIVTDMVETTFFDSTKTQWISNIGYVASGWDIDTSADTLSWNLTAIGEDLVHNSTDINYTLLNITDIFNISDYDSSTNDSKGLLLADVYILATISAHVEPVQAFHCNLSLGMQVYESYVHNGIFVERPTEFLSGIWVQAYDNQTKDAYWSLVAEVSGAQREVRLGYSSWSQIYGYGKQGGQPFTSPFNGNVFSPGDQLSYPAYTNDFVYTLWMSYDLGGPSSIDSTFESLANSMTNYFRVATTATAEGTAQALESYIHVRWLFLILPLIVVILACFFVTAASLQSRRLGIPSWRSSILAAVYSQHFGDSKAADPTQQDCPATYLGPPRDYDRVSHLMKWAELRQAGLNRKHAPFSCDSIYGSTCAGSLTSLEKMDAPYTAETRRTANWI